MRFGRIRLSPLWAALCCAGFLLVAAIAAPSALAIARSQNVAIVPDPSGDSTYGGSNGGTLPTTGFPNGYAPAFTNVTPESIRDDAADPLASDDTVVLVQFCTIGQFLSNAQFKSRLQAVLQRGGKILIWDSECSSPSPDYSNFFVTFQSNNPGPNGASGTVTDLEDNSLSSTNSSSPNFVNITNLGQGEIGDANVFTTFDKSWCLDLKGTNVSNVTGPMQTYTKFANGLIVYTGFDMDDLGSGTFDPNGSAGDQLDRLFMNQLLQPTNPDNLPCGAKVLGLTLTPKAATNPVGISHTVTASVVSNGSPATNVPVTFTVTSGPNQGRTGTANTGSTGTSAGQAKFTYSSNGKAGTDTITATANIPKPDGTTVQVSDTAQKTWSAANQLGLPHVKGCVDTRKFSFKLHHRAGSRVVDVVVFINGKRKRHVSGSNIKKLTLKKLPKKTFLVEIVATQNTGGQLTSVRKYKGCKKGKSKTRRTHTGHH